MLIERRIPLKIEHTMTFETDEIADTDPRPKPPYARITLTVVVTALTALVLSIFGYIPLDPVTAVISGCLVSLVFVCYQSYYLNQVDRSSINP
ncbi:MAG: hypothetical protein JSW61_13000 [Candidatus Thorarchaeota archaeon]|nr:MAG: hypothetical protein JSW61_13000 [Candidatus Thorarchaeota archaeon]